MTRINIIIVLFLLSLPMVASSLTPPPEHPRLYLRSCDIPALREKVRSEQGQAVLSRMVEMAEPRTDEEEIPSSQRDFRYYFEMRGLPSKVELLALDYLLEGNSNSAREAITMVLDSLRKTDFPTSRDLSRASGVMLVAGAVVYDWCYDCLTVSEKEAFVMEFKRIASTMECGYPIRVVEPLAGHTCEWMIMRDMLSAGIAIYDEYPDMFNEASKVIRERFVPFRDLCYKAGNYHQGSKYLPTRYSAELFAQWIITRMGGTPFFCDEQKSLLYDVIYRMRPDGMTMPSGDENPSPCPRDENFALPAMLASSYYRDAYIRTLYESNTEVIAHSLLFDLLWNDFSVSSEAYDSLPLTRFCPFPFGWMVARTGWDENSVIFEAKINNQIVGNHQHLDGGSFQIYHNGALALDSGIYEGTAGGYNSDHCRNYSKRTIAHNSLLIYNPSERFAWYRHKGKEPRYCSNDGGQRMPGATGWDPAGSLEEMLSDEYRMGQTISYYSDSDISYLSGDITDAYSDKVDMVRRSFVFCNMHSEVVPAVLVIQDEISSTDPSFRKIFLMHSMEKPQVGSHSYGIRRTADGQDGLLDCSVLFPKKVSISAVGGPGHEFDVFGVDYPNSVEGDPDVEAGSWRVEVCPVTRQKDDVFLNVIEISDAGHFKEARVRRYENETLRGADFRGSLVLFTKGMDCSMSLRIPAGGRDVTICGLPEGTWKINGPGAADCVSEVRAGENIIRFKAVKGNYMISRQ